MISIYYKELDFNDGLPIHVTGVVGIVVEHFFFWKHLVVEQGALEEQVQVQEVGQPPNSLLTKFWPLVGKKWLAYYKLGTWLVIEVSVFYST